MIPAAQFVKSLKGTHDEIWTRLILGMHKMENKTVADWKSLIENYKNQPAAKS